MRGVRLGNSEKLTAIRPDQPQNEVTLILKEGLKKVTNLIILSGKKRYIFDVIPSEKFHQDALDIIGSYGGADTEELFKGAVMIDSSE
jgi:hypothetical protein